MEVNYLWREKNMDPVTVKSGAIRPFKCYSEGWALIKGQYWLFMGVCFVGSLIGGMAPMAVLMGPMMCGIYMCFMKRAEGKPAEFGTLFDGFSLFVESLIASLIMIVPAIVLLIPAYIFTALCIAFVVIPRSGEGQAPENAMLIPKILLAASPMLVAIALIIAIYMFVFTFVYPLIADKKLKAVEAVKWSFKAGKANIGGLILLFLTNVLVSLVGVLMCYVGAFFVMPLTFGAFFAAYKRVFGEGPV